MNNDFLRISIPQIPLRGYFEKIPLSCVSDFRNRLAGPLVTIALVATLAIFSNRLPELFDPFPFLFLSTVYAAFQGGIYSSLTSALISGIYAFYHFSNPGSPGDFTPHHFQHMVSGGIATFSVALVTGFLKRNIFLKQQAEIKNTHKEEIERIQKEFLSSVVHELRTPITSLKLFIQLHLMRLEKTGKDRMLPYELRFADHELDRLSRLVSDISDLQRIEMEKFTLEKQEIDLGSIIYETVAQLRSMAGKRKLVMEGGAGYLLEADTDRIRQVTTNLLTNAFKHSPENSRVRVSLNKNNGFAKVSVEDQGEGIPKDKLPLIFNKFYQVNEAQRSGFGLGLFISREIIKAHHGKIWATSKRGKGSTFYFTLPLS